MPVTDLQLLIFIVTSVLSGGLILATMYKMFKCIFDKFNELRKKL
jgi:hypothetical protein